MNGSVIYPRWQERTVRQLLSERRVLLLSGLRQCGKSTLAAHYASSPEAYRTLDDQTFYEVAKQDPQGFVSHDYQTLVIDEVQRIPELLPAIKRVVDQDQRPGRYLLTGSTDIQALPSVRESLAGRIAKIRLRPLSIGERFHAVPQFIDRMFDGIFDPDQRGIEIIHSREDLIQLAFAGGLPEPSRLNQKSRTRWHRDYITALLDRDLREITNIRRRDTMDELIRILAGWSGKFMDLSAIGSGLSVKRDTLQSYVAALEALYLIERVKPWTKSDYARVGKLDKLFFTDVGLMASILRWRADQIALAPDRVGKLFETLIHNELAVHADGAAGSYELFHYRDREKREIDFLIERDDGALLGIEVKAAASVQSRDFKHLRWFRDTLAKDRPFIGCVLYNGDFFSRFDADLYAVPYSELWR